MSMMIGMSGKRGLGLSTALGLCLLLQAGTAGADMIAIGAGFGIGQIGIAGTGCPQGTARIVSGQLQAPYVTIQFDRYAAKIPAGQSAALKRANCSIALPLFVPPGFRAVLSDFSAQGYMALPKGSSATVSVEPFQAGSQGQVYEGRVKGSYSNDGRDLNLAIPGVLVRTACGQDSVILRLATSARVEAKGWHRDSLLELGDLTFSARLEPCHN
jgi:hypothetical protein